MFTSSKVSSSGTSIRVFISQITKGWLIVNAKRNHVMINISGFSAAMLPKSLISPLLCNSKQSRLFSSSSQSSISNLGDIDSSTVLEEAAIRGDINAQYEFGRTILFQFSSSKIPDRTEDMNTNSSTNASDSRREVLQQINDATKNARKKKRQMKFTKDNSTLKQRVFEASKYVSVEKFHSKESGLEWLRRAAAGGHRLAMMVLANSILRSDQHYDGYGSLNSGATQQPSTGDRLDLDISRGVLNSLRMNSLKRGEEVSEAVSLYHKAAGLVSLGSLNDYVLTSGYNDEIAGEALFNLGIIYYEGIQGFVDVDHIKSLHLFSLAAEKCNDGDAAYWLGHCFLQGESMATIDVSKGIEYLEVAASQLHGGAHYYLASLYRSGLVNGDSGSVLPNKEKFSTHLMQAVQMESPDALFCLADLHMHGSEANIDINHKTAVALYDQARQLGHGDATLALGTIYYNGLTSIQLLPDKTMAFKLYNEAAELGNLDAWRNLAAMYFMGDGVPKCENTAREIMRVIFHK